VTSEPPIPWDLGANEVKEQLQSLESGTAYHFSDWPNEAVPKVSAGVYTIWEADRLIYGGMAGRGIRADNVDSPDEPVKAKGLWTR
jgi:hypothetical protein